MCQQDLNCERGRGAVHLIHWKTDFVQTVTKSSILISNAPNRTSQATKIWPLDLVGLYIPNIAMSYYLDSFDKKDSMAHDKNNFFAGSFFNEKVWNHKRTAVGSICNYCDASLAQGLILTIEVIKRKWQVNLQGGALNLAHIPLVPPTLGLCGAGLPQFHRWRSRSLSKWHSSRQ